MHPINKRRHKAVDQKYKKSFLTSGVVEGVSGTPWLVMSEGEQLPYQAITWGSLSRAFYAAAEEEPNNEFIKASIQSGLRGASIFSSKTPTEVLQWLCDYHNAFHGGAGYSVAQLLMEVGTMEAASKDTIRTHSVVGMGADA